jgi:hypothetical protein
MDRKYTDEVALMEASIVGADLVGRGSLDTRDDRRKLAVLTNGRL